MKNTLKKNCVFVNESCCFIHCWRVCTGRKLRSERTVKCVASVNTGAVGAKLKLGYTHTHVAYCNRKNTEIGNRHPGEVKVN